MSKSEPEAVICGENDAITVQVAAFANVLVQGREPPDIAEKFAVATKGALRLMTAPLLFEIIKENGLSALVLPASVFVKVWEIGNVVTLPKN